MPLYDYRCAQCQHTFEVLHGRDANGPSECPLCQATTPEKQMSSGHFHLKGGGWYVTDIKDKIKNTGDTADAAGTDNTQKTTPASNDSATPPSSDSSTPSTSPTTPKDSSD